MFGACERLALAAETRTGWQKSVETLSKVIAIIQRMTFLFNHFVVPIICAVTAEETVLACKNAEKYAISTLIFLKNFSGGIAPDPHTGDGLWRPSPDPTPLALHACAPRSGPSVPPSPSVESKKILKLYYAGTFAPGSESSRERMFQGAKVLGSSRERKF